ncbi:MAG: squalene/phytoene synthase family protein [Sandarakinorhabdus sp.]|jgi:phytoene synthase|nr:squalene/phytoene synthase family protein [Sandarakinorhabdus sp.]
MDPLSIIADELKQRDRERWLACLYAAAPARPGLVALFALDAELAHVVATTTEPLLGEIRLAWWRDRLIELDTQPAPAQPLLQALQARVLPRLSGAELATLEDGWLARLGGTAGEGAAQLFGLAARLLGGDPEEGTYLGQLLAAAERSPNRTSVLLRPLRALVELAARDAANHAAGRPPEMPGSLARQALMFKVVALGR